MRELIILLGAALGFVACNDLPPPPAKPQAALAPTLTRVGDEAVLTATLDLKVQYGDNYRRFLRGGRAFFAFVYSPKPGTDSTTYERLPSGRVNFPVSEVVEFLDPPPAGGTAPAVASTVDEGSGIAAARFRLRAAEPGTAELRVGFALGFADQDPSAAGRTHGASTDAVLAISIK